MFRFRLATFMIVILSFASAGAQSLEAPRLSVSFEEIHGADPSKSYVMAVIRPESEDAPPAKDQIVPKSLLEIANDWSIDHYRARYPEEAAESFEKMRRKGIRLTEGSSFIMVFDRNDPAKIAGTLWTAYPDAEGRIELEYNLDWRYPRTPPHVAPYPMLQSSEAAGFQSPDRMQGGVVEFKRLVLDPASPRELMPAMLVRGESHDRLNMQPMNYVHGSFAGQVLPAEYALYCARKLVPIYLRFGFTLVQDQPIKGEYVMSINRANYVANAEKWIAKARQSGWSLRFDKPNISRSVEIELRVRSQLRSKSRPSTCRNVFGS